ncbi:MAG: tetratricopeptide repeat protein [Saprospiraceae bacterium]|nr:tetratricopeptide repeat protein [Saprospiraceae bacterium]MDW8230748.1 tetratricopeptide repeat protein [Saprospiraceae bacterium]
MMVFFQKIQPLRLLLLLCAALLSAGASSQSRHSYERAGDKAFEQKDYGAALHYYQTALSRKPDDPALLWKSAESARYIYADPLAERWYRQLEAMEKRKPAYPLLTLRLGETLRKQGKYEEAARYFEQFLEQKPSAELAEAARVGLQACRWASQQKRASDAIVVKNAGKHINSPYSDFAPALVGDSLFFSSYRFDKRGDKSTPKIKLTKVMLSVKNGRPREAARPFPSTDTAHVAHTAIFGNGHFLLFTLCKNRNASDIRCDLWLSIKDIRNRWTAPVRLPEPINLGNYTTTQPHVAFDTAAEQLLLWFVSDRPGGYGGLDLWYTPLDTNWFCPCHIPVDARKPFPLPAFTPPTNLSALNTPGDEATPFFHEPTQTLYFSSNGRAENFGGFDIYQTRRKKDGSLEVPQNVGPELNTPYNDLYLILSPDGYSGYLSSNRPGAQYLDEANKFCCNDLFTVQFPTPPDTTPAPPTTAAPPRPTPPLERPTIPIEQLNPPKLPAPTPQLKDFVGLLLYFDNDEPDRRTRRTTTQKNYAETIVPYLERQSEYRERFAAGLKGAQRDSAEQQIDLFFDNEARRGYERLEQLCELLLERLQAGETVEIVLKGYTSPRAESDYNLALGKRRVSSVRNYFGTYGNGAFLPFFRSGQLKVSETSFGEATARRGISDDLRDERNSIYHPDAARERRVEIVEIRQ